MIYKMLPLTEGELQIFARIDDDGKYRLTCNENHPEFQAWLAEGNNEWPVVPGVKTNNGALDSLGLFKADALPVEAIGAAQSTAAQLIDRVGWR